MATKPLGVNLTNCVIDWEAGLIIEYPKKKDDSVKVYNIEKLISQFNGVEGISFSISGKIEVTPDDTKY